MGKRLQLYKFDGNSSLRYSIFSTYLSTKLLEVNIEIVPLGGNERRSCILKYYERGGGEYFVTF